MLERFIRIYTDASVCPAKVRVNTVKYGEWVYEVRLVKEHLQDGDLISRDPIDKLQIVKRQVDDTFSFFDLKMIGKTIFFTEEEARKAFDEARKELGW